MACGCCAPLVSTGESTKTERPTEKFRRDFEAFSSATDWSEVQPAFNDAFHPDLRVVTPEGELDKGQWEETVRGLPVKGVKTTDFEVAREEGDTVYYGMTLTFPNGEQLHPSSKVTIKDGQVVRVEPVDPETYSKLVQTWTDPAQPDSRLDQGAPRCVMVTGKGARCGM